MANNLITCAINTQGGRDITNARNNLRAGIDQFRNELARMNQIVDDNTALQAYYGTATSQKAADLKAETASCGAAIDNAEAALEQWMARVAPVASQ